MPFCIQKPDLANAFFILVNQCILTAVEVTIMFDFWVVN